MALLKVQRLETEILLNTPNREEILKDGPPQNFKYGILGKGAFGTVFKAVFQGEQVAVKIIKNQKNHETTLNEANVLGWDHRNIVKVLQIETTPNFGLVIMERFTGQCLEMILDRIELPLIHRVFVCLDTLSALAYCHNHGILHLDVKPQNVLVSFGKCPVSFPRSREVLASRRSYVCKLCDFGSSTRVSKPLPSTTTAKGCARGTVRYMSPEALRERPLGPATDIYSLGVMMWQLQQRQLPYFWINCNDVVAYQVVKYNLRPDALGDSDQRQRCGVISPAHRNCLCESYSSEMSSHSVDSIRIILKHVSAQEDDFFPRAIRNPRKVQSTSFRKPLRELSSQSRVVRDLSSALGVKVHQCPQRRAEGLDSLDDFNIFATFSHVGSKPNGDKEFLFKELYRDCWQSDCTMRPNAVEIRTRLERLL